MSRLGMKIFIRHLAGNNRGQDILDRNTGKIIRDLKINEDRDTLEITFNDNKIGLFDDGQSCCEYRYMSTDDDLSYFIGAELREVSIRSGSNEPDEFGEHEIEFMLVTTSKGTFTIVNHNEHNGYYGGFWISVKELD